MLIDTHCHLSKNDYDNIESVVENMDGIMIISGCNDETNLEVIKYVNAYDNVYGTLGIHPENINDITQNSFKIIEENINNKKIVGIGEIGLDYYWVKDNKELQKQLLKKQLDIASKYNKSVVIHTRDSIQDTYDILKDYKLKGTIHCFNSSIEMAYKFIKLGYKIGVGGVVTFKNSKKLVELVKNLEIENILLETDSPYLTPEPYRGKKNEPENVYYVAKKISEIKNIDLKDVVDITMNNAIKQFDLNI